MKLIRFGDSGKEKPGFITHDGKRKDISAFGKDYTETFFATDGLNRLRTWLEQNGKDAPIVSDAIRLGPPIARPSKIICIGLNYSDHAKESNMPVPPEPVIFFKSSSALVGPNDDLILPKNSMKVDWEVELAVVIGAKATYVAREKAMDYIAGYALHNDYSERHFQLERSGQWVKGKSCDTFGPLGPFLVTKDEITEVKNMRLWLKVNGEMKQDGNTRNFIWDVSFLVSYISQFMSLLPGDVISTGTPAGVGLGFNPPQYLKPGDVVELGIDGLGSSRQHVKSYEQMR
ncbi:MAG: fumarylacetoacetate hydrolase family protein [Ignavibacteria bacterium]|nr:fumarylacetoacetate hydrolase family protein [Ignavibacteria bacterium]MBI3766029.1 fumarylacetoacetate hydrolase family protein [Ignavibacteriales bacterium]